MNKQIYMVHIYNYSNLGSAGTDIVRPTDRWLTVAEAIDVNDWLKMLSIELTYNRRTGYGTRYTVVMDEDTYLLFKLRFGFELKLFSERS